MDDLRFDALTRSLTIGRSRRGMLRVLAAATLGALISARTARDAAAACREAGQRCNAAHGCCSGSRCRDGSCRCKESQNFFAYDGPGTRCVNIGTNEKHCGGCGTEGSQCDPDKDEICLNGGCVFPC